MPSVFAIDPSSSFVATKDVVSMKLPIDPSSLFILTVKIHPPIPDIIPGGGGWDRPTPRRRLCEPKFWKPPLRGPRIPRQDVPLVARRIAEAIPEAVDALDEVWDRERKALAKRTSVSIALALNEGDVADGVAATIILLADDKISPKKK